MREPTVRAILNRLEAIVVIRGVHKTLGACTPTDLEWLAGQHDRLTNVYQGLANTTVAAAEDGSLST